MRFMARRILSGEWVTRDLPLTDVESVVNLSAPGSISGNLEPEANRVLWDSRRLVEDWATMIYAVSDSGEILNFGIVLPPTEYDTLAKIQCMGISGYAQGYLYDGEGEFWGPRPRVPAVRRKNGSVKTPPRPAVDRPDSIQVYRDFWAWILRQPDSGLDVEITGDREGVRIGSNAEPIRLRRYELTDMGSAMDELAQATPFEYAERAFWRDGARQSVRHEINLGKPRQGRRRDDLRFAQDENVPLLPSITTLEGGNKLIGVGHGDPGPKMVYRESVWHDGRLRRQRIITDKTANAARIATLMKSYRDALQQPYDITSVAVVDHQNAPLTALRVGDDIRLIADHPEYGAINTWLRILSITRGESDHTAMLTTANAAFFTYGRDEELT